MTYDSIENTINSVIHKRQNTLIS